MKYPAQSALWRLAQVTPKFERVINGHDGSLGQNRESQSRVLARFRQIFPFTLFPSSLIVEELRILYVKRYGPWTNEVVSIMATDIACVYASTGLILGQIHIKSLTGGPEIYIDNLFRRDVLTIRSMVEGIALASREGLKVNHGEDLEEERKNFLKAGAIHYG